MKKRIFIIFIFMTFCLFLLLIRLGYVQIVAGSFINKRAQDLWSREVPIDGVRGCIYDRNGKLIVGNMISPSIAVIPRQLENAELTADFLSRMLKADRNSILNHLKKKVNVEMIKPEGRKINRNVALEILKANIKGVYVVSETTRYYPYEKLLANVLGFTGIDNQGIAGIEYIYDSYLKGSYGALKIYTDAKGNLVDNSTGIYEGSVRGMDIYLTIDLKIQQIVENVVTNAINRYNPEQMMVVVSNVKTGEIYAMSSYPNYDPANYQDYNQEYYNRNLPIWMSFEPGSTFKIVTYATGLEEKAFSLDEGFYDPGYAIVDGAYIKDWRAGGHH